MKSLKYTVIKNEDQYYNYCNILEELIATNNPENRDEIELLSLLIEKWDNDHNTFKEKDPVFLLKSLMEDHQLKSKDLAEILSLSKGTVSKILNYQKGFSKDTIRKLSQHFEIGQEAFNRPYSLVSQNERHLENA